MIQAGLVPFDREASSLRSGSSIKSPRGWQKVVYEIDKEAGNWLASVISLMVISTKLKSMLKIHRSINTRHKIYTDSCRSNVNFVSEKLIKYPFGVNVVSNEKRTKKFIF